MDDSEEKKVHTLTQEEEEANFLAEILVQFGVGINPDIDEDESFRLIYNELLMSGLGVSNAKAIGKLCRITVAGQKTRYAH